MILSRKASVGLYPSIFITLVLLYIIVSFYINLPSTHPFVTVPGKTQHVAKILKIVIAHLHGTTTHDLAATRFWKRSPVQFFRYDAFYSSVSAILELRNYDLNTLLRRWGVSVYFRITHKRTRAVCKESADQDKIDNDGNIR